MEEQDNDTQYTAQDQVVASQDQYVAPTDEERAAASERAAELARRNYELVYPSGFSEQYPHLANSKHVEMGRNLSTALVKNGYIEPKDATVIMNHFVKHFDEDFHEAKKSEADNKAKQYNIDIQRLREATADSDVSEERLKHVVYKRLEQHHSKGIANWMSKALDNPQTVALLNYMGVATPRDDAASRDLYDPKLTEADLLADMNEIRNNVTNKRTPLHEAAPRLLELNEALGRLRKSGVSKQVVRR